MPRLFLARLCSRPAPRASWRPTLELKLHLLAPLLFVLTVLCPPLGNALAAGLTPPSASIFSPDSLRSRPEFAKPQQPADENTIATVDLTNTPDDLWDRIRNGFAMPDLVSETVTAQQIWFLNRPDYIRRTFERSRRYLYYIVDQLEKRGMPTELALLPVVESAYNPMAYSPARASGIWQFIPSTGRNFGLKQDSWQDERRDIVASTNAALDYLQTLYEMQGDWHLALASYNWGEGAVMRAVNKNKAAGKPTDYLNLTMPNETRNYVPRLQAIKNVVAHPELFGIKLDPIPNRPYFATVGKVEDMDLATAARLAEMPLEEFKALNPSHTRQVVRGSAGANLVVPTEKLDTFRSNYENRDKNQDKPALVIDKPFVTDRAPSSFTSGQDVALETGLESGLLGTTPMTRDKAPSWKSYSVKSGEDLDDLAERFGTSVTKLRQMNGLGSRARLSTGQTLLIPAREGGGLSIRSDETAPAAPNRTSGRYALLTPKKASGIFSRNGREASRVTYRIERRWVKDRHGRKHMVIIKHKVKAGADDDDDEEDDKPVKKGKAGKVDAKSAKNAKAGKSRRAQDDDEDDEDEKPTKKGKASKADAKKAKAKSRRAQDDDDDEDEKPVAKAKAKGGKSAKASKSRRASDDDDDDDEPVKAKSGKAAKNSKKGGKADKAKGGKAGKSAKSGKSGKDAKKKKH